MTEADFRNLIQAAGQMRRLTDFPESDFWAGYARGLRRLFHGEDFGTAQEHELWLSLADEADRSRHMRGVGYRAGFAGTPIPLAIAQQKEPA